MKLIRNLTGRRRRRGQGMTEYIIIVGLIAIVLIAAIKKFSTALETTYGQAEAGVTAVGTEIGEANTTNASTE